MKNFKTFLTIAFIATTLLFASCNSDDDALIIANNEISVQDLTVAIDENPTNGDVIGTVVATQTEGGGNLAYSISAQTPAGGLSINASTGEVTVLDETLFDFETNPVITATVSVDGTINTGVITINLANINEIGDFNYGGIVFWIDPTDSTKGLVCAVTDQSSSIRWHNTTQPSITGTTSESIQTGSINTDLIIASLGNSYAAGVARAYNGGGFNDWFLPSVDELYEMGNNRALINSSATANSGTDLVAEPANVSNGYWSSSQQTVNNSVYLVNLLSVGKNGGFATNFASVRAVREF